MYKYDQYDQAIVDARVDEFRDQVQRRLAGGNSQDAIVGLQNHVQVVPHPLVIVDYEERLLAI